MKGWTLVFSVFILILLLGASYMFLYRYTGLSQFEKVALYIDRMPLASDRDQAWTDFNGIKTKIFYSGILAGTWMNKIWVWGRDGLRPFTPDQYTVYSYLDGCATPIIQAIDNGDIATPEAKISDEINIWKGQAMVGDYVSLALTDVNQGGTVGNLREIYTYNYWPFTQQDIRTECAK